MKITFLSVHGMYRVSFGPVTPPHLPTAVLYCCLDCRQLAMSNWWWSAVYICRAPEQLGERNRYRLCRRTLSSTYQPITNHFCIIWNIICKMLIKYVYCNGSLSIIEKLNYKNICNWQLHPYNEQLHSVSIANTCGTWVTGLISSLLFFEDVT